MPDSNTTTRTGLDRIADRVGRFAVLAMDQRATLRRMLAATDQPRADADLQQFKIDVVSALSPHASAVLLDPEYGVTAVREAGALATETGLLIAAEPPSKATWHGETRTTVDPERDAAWVASLGGDALKFLVSWRPGRPFAAGEPDLAGEALARVAEVVADCQATGMPSVIEPLVASLPEEPKLSSAAKHELVIESALAMATLNPALLKLEWPGDATGCARISEGLGHVPWTLLSAGVAYDEFVQRVRIALDNGASGFIAGRAIWGEAVTMVGEERRTFLRDVAAPRLAGLVDVMADRGRPWRAVTS
jgi:sulfofructosephosphate aldolase